MANETEAGQVSPKDRQVPQIKFDNEAVTSTKAKILVIGVGGAGCNAVNRMIEDGVSDVTFCTANTDAQALSLSKAPIRILLGKELTHGLGAGGQPEVGKEAAEKTLPVLKKLMADQDMVFVAAGMGGGTGTGGAPVIAKAAHDGGALTVAVVTKPFNFEGKLRMTHAAQGISELSHCVDSFIVVSNDKLMLTHGDMSSMEAFAESDRTLSRTVSTISDLINKPGYINLDFADVKSTLKGSGLSVIGFGQASGENKIQEAVRKAISSPLLEASVKGAGKLLVNITNSKEVSMKDVGKTVDFINETSGKTDNVIFGAMYDPSLKDTIRVAVIATAFNLGPTALEKEGDANGSKALGGKPIANGEGKEDQVLPGFLQALLGSGKIPPVGKANEDAAKKAKQDQDQLRQANDKNAALERELASQKAQVDGLNRELALLKESNAKLGRENGELEKAKNDLESQVQSLPELRQSLSDEDSEKESLQTKISAYENKISDLNLELESARNDLAAAQGHGSDLASLLGTANAKVDSLNSRLESLAKENEGLKAQTNQSSGLLGQLRQAEAQKDSLLGELTKIKAELAQSETQKAELSKQVKENADEIAALRAQAEKLNGAVDTYQKRGDSYQARLRVSLKTNQELAERLSAQVQRAESYQARLRLSLAKVQEIEGERDGKEEGDDEPNDESDDLAKSLLAKLGQGGK